MLTKRTNILFDDSLWKELSRYAKKQQVSVGEVVRTAVHMKLEREQNLEERKKAIIAIKKLRPSVSKTPIDYKALINYGRAR